MFACFQEKTREHFLRDFFVGIEGPYTLEPQPLPEYKDLELGITFIGIGAEGVKTALETAAVIYAEGDENNRRYIQSGARYGAARKGAPVFMNLRISSSPIRNASELTENDVLAFFNDKFLSGEILRHYVGGLKENGLLVANSTRTTDELLDSFPPEIRKFITAKKIKFIAMDATQAALKHLKRNLPGAMILGLINGETGMLSADAFEKKFKSILEEKLGPKKGHEIVQSNTALLKEGAQLTSSTPEALTAIAAASDDRSPSAAVKPENFGKGPGSAGLRVKLSPKDELGTIKPIHIMENFQEQFNKDMLEPILEGKKVPWDRFLPIVPAATSRARDMSYIATQLPVWDAKKCVSCGMCAASCPDSAVYTTITDQPLPEGAVPYFRTFKKPPRGIPWKRFALNINAIDDRCKGCGICAEVCPVDAFKMVDKAQVSAKDFLPEQYQNLDKTYDAARYVDRMALNHQVLYVFSKLYPGKHTLCPGCGEGTINLLTFFACVTAPKVLRHFTRGSRFFRIKTGGP